MLWFPVPRVLINENTSFSDCASPNLSEEFFTEMEEKRRKQGNGPKGLLFGAHERERERDICRLMCEE